MIVPRSAIDTVKPSSFARQVENLGELLRGAGDDGGVEPEEQAAKRADNDAPDQ